MASTVPSSCRYRSCASCSENLIELTPTSSCAVPVVVKVVVGITVPVGPVIEVVGVASASPNVSNFLNGSELSLLPFVPKVRDRTSSDRFAEIVNGNDHAVDVAPGAARFALIELTDVDHVTRSSWSHCCGDPRWIISSWTRWTPLVAVAVPSTTNSTSACSTRPSIGFTILDSLASGPGSVLRS